MFNFYRRIVELTVKGSHIANGSTFIFQISFYSFPNEGQI